jgi:hypothetical protein
LLQKYLTGGFPVVSGTKAYEVDYLVTPALGGSDDIHNLWPHSYSATAWNAEVKDALEDRLRGMVCDGSLDLTEAQREIASKLDCRVQEMLPYGPAAGKPLEVNG